MVGRTERAGRGHVAAVSGLVLLLLAAGLGTTSAAAASPDALSTSVTSRSSARSTADQRTVGDTQVGTRRVLATDLRVSASATGDATCRQCTGTAVTVQVLYAYGTHGLTVRNDARATSTCVTCGSSALSLQIVVTDAPQRLRASNSAEAVSTWCLGCTSVAAAVQVVLVDPGRRQLDAAGRARVAQLGGRMAALLARTASDSAGARWRLTPAEVGLSLRADGRRLVAVVQEELGGTVVAEGLVVRSR